MRYFLILDGSNVVGKNVYSGDDEKADAMALRDAGNFVALEVSYDVFEETLIAPKASPDQAEWLEAKAGGPDQAITFLAKRLGLE